MGDTTTTTIALDAETKAALDEIAPAGHTWDERIATLVDEHAAFLAEDVYAETEAGTELAGEIAALGGEVADLRAEFDRFREAFDRDLAGRDLGP